MHQRSLLAFRAVNRCEVTPCFILANSAMTAWRRFTATPIARGAATLWEMPSREARPVGTAGTEGARFHWGRALISVYTSLGTKALHDAILGRAFAQCRRNHSVTQRRFSHVTRWQILVTPSSSYSNYNSSVNRANEFLKLVSDNLKYS